MNGTGPKIEIFKPFGEAFELTKKILFQPFNFQKWLIIGFAAFLANLSGGYGFNFNFQSPWDRGRSWRGWNERSEQIFSWNQMPAWVIPVAIAAVIVVLAIAIVLMWIGSRGRFIFTDCVVKNRGAIIAPWHEFRNEGNSFFLFSLLIAGAFVAIGAVLCLPIVVPLMMQGGSAGFHVFLISGLVFAGSIIFLLVLGWALVSHFMVPVMYRRRCRAREGFSAVTSLIATYPGEIVIYCLFWFVLVLASAIIGCASLCVTCCITAIPYVGTVILLPVFVLLRSFSLLFLRQFGSDYDVWAGHNPIAMVAAGTSSPPPIPPIQA